MYLDSSELLLKQVYALNSGKSDAFQSLLNTDLSTSHIPDSYLNSRLFRWPPLVLHPLELSAYLPACSTDQCLGHTAPYLYDACFHQSLQRRKSCLLRINKLDY